MTAEAERDLAEIFEYVAFELEAFQTAAALLHRLDSAIKSLADMPERFRRYAREPWRSRNLRLCQVDNYLVLYIPQKETQTVIILRVIYGGRDIPGLLAEME